MTYRTVVIIIALSLFLTMLFTRLDMVELHGNSDLKHLNFGFPLPFVLQDQSGYGPPYRTKAGFSSPWECPTHLNQLAFLADTAIFSIALTTGYFTIIRLLNKQGRK